ncbi:MAG TPA: ATP-binding protein [Chitinophagaceae bacterium]
MRRTLITIIFLFELQLAHAQNANIDSLKNLLAATKDDSTRFTLLGELSMDYLWSYPDSSLPYMQQAILLARKMKSEILLARAYRGYSWFYVITGDYPQALHFNQEALKLAEKAKNNLAIARSYDLMELIYEDQGNYQLALSYEKMAKSFFESQAGDHKPDMAYYVTILNGLASVYEKLNQLDSALKYIQIVDNAYEKLHGKKWSAASYELGNIYLKKKEYPTALQHYRNGVAFAVEIDNKKDLMDNCNGLANTFKKIGEFDSSIFYANKVLEVSRSARYSLAQLTALNHLADIYKSKHNSDSVAKYLQLTINAKDSLFSQQKVLQIQNMTFNQQLRQQEETQLQKELQNKIKLYSLLSALVIAFVIAFILYRSNRHKQKAYALLRKQKQETDIQKSKVEQTLEELKATQAQLIQSEKMASLGELTAGIAHEIQNPLNFVNNFSEISVELAGELKEKLNGIELPASDKENIEMIIDDLVQNQQKINHHGKRADSIVKGMLQHSRTSTGQKELTDINELLDEYLRLSYHGLRAKDKTFNATLQTDFDENVGKINIISQDIGRVFLNLFTNAFYSVMQKKKELGDGLRPVQAGFEPTVYVSTRKIDSPANDGTGSVEIHVKDNGTGIPQRLMDKIFQPFFTTKPAGQGTGLGLSLSYDIITKGHGGTIKVETKEGECAEFIIVLPAKSQP